MVIPDRRLGRAGGTQVDHVDDDRGFIAPSLNYRPDGTTTLTFLAQYQRDFTQPLNFLPYEDTVKAAPFGRIPTSLFTSDPAVLKFNREQALVGYQFEHVFSDTLMVRQNLRYGYLDVHYVTPFGEGYVDEPTATDALLQRATYLFYARTNELAVDTQAETRFTTLGVDHDVLAGIDDKRYTLDQQQGQDDAAPLTCWHPSTTS